MPLNIPYPVGWSVQPHYIIQRMTSARPWSANTGAFRLLLQSAVRPTCRLRILAQDAFQVFGHAISERVHGVMRRGWADTSQWKSLLVPSRPRSAGMGRQPLPGAWRMVADWRRARRSAEH